MLNCRRSVVFRAIGLTVSLLGILSAAAPAALAVLAAGDSFVYTSGQALNGQSGGTGWKTATPWSGDSGSNSPGITSSGLGYNDGGGRVLNVSGNAVIGRDNNFKKNERELANTNLATNGNSVWVSVLIQGATGGGTSGRAANISLEDKFFIGQGSSSATSVNWSIYDQTGLKFTSSIVAGGTTAFLVALIEFQSGNERAWFWVDPVLDVTPAKSDALNTSLGTAIADFTFGKAMIWLNRNNNGIVDELRIGTSYQDVAPFSVIPESSAFALVGLVGGLAVGVPRLARRWRKTSS